METSTWKCPRCGEVNAPTVGSAGYPERQQTCPACGLEVDVEPPAKPVVTFTASEAKPALSAKEYQRQIRSQTRFAVARAMNLVGAIILMVGIPIAACSDLFTGVFGRFDGPAGPQGETILAIAGAAAVTIVLELTVWALYQVAIVVFDMADTLLDIGRRDRT
jgi:hypothetical protein